MVEYHVQPVDFIAGCYFDIAQVKHFPVAASRRSSEALRVASARSSLPFLIADRSILPRIHFPPLIAVTPRALTICPLPSSGRKIIGISSEL